MEPEERRHPHWHYFLTLEEDLYECCRHVEPVEANFSTFSLEFARLLMASCAEIEVVMKEWRRLNSISDLTFEATLQKIALSHTWLKDAVIVRRSGLMIRPWRDDCLIEQVPRWWRSHTDVKHHRAQYFDRANLGNAIYATAGLYTLVVAMYSREYFCGELYPRPKLFKIDGELGPLYGQMADSLESALERSWKAQRDS